MKRIALFALVALLTACGSDDSKSTPTENNAEKNANNVDSNHENNAGNDANNVDPNNANNTGNNANNANNSGAVTWHKDVRPLVESNCSSCHYDGGIGPFALDSYDAARPFAPNVAMAVEEGSMPPWPPAENCGDFRDPAHLSDAEVEVFREWANAGMPEGDESDYVAPETSATPQLGEPDFVVDIGTDYKPAPPDGGIDDYHCFVIDPDFDSEKFLTAYETKPGNISVVHHMLFWAVDPSQQGRIDELTAQDPSTPGYTCFGGNRVDSVQGLLGGWVPGAPAIQYGEDVGIRIPQDSLIVVQIHYNTINGDDPDRTHVDLHFTDGEPAEKIQMFPMPDTSLFLPAGDANARAGNSFTLPIPVKVYGVFPHMHTLGTRIKVSYSNRGEDTCLVDIPDWDFNWQNIYLYKDPVTVPANSTVQLDCWYDNSPANQPGGMMPRDVTWGEGTYDEMCLNYFVVEELPL